MLRNIDPDLVNEEDEDVVFTALFDHLPFLSNHELKRRAHEIV